MESPLKLFHDCPPTVHSHLSLVQLIWLLLLLLFFTPEMKFQSLPSERLTTGLCLERCARTCRAFNCAFRQIFVPTGYFPVSQLGIFHIYGADL